MCCLLPLLARRCPENGEKEQERPVLLCNVIKRRARKLAAEEGGGIRQKVKIISNWQLAGRRRRREEQRWVAQRDLNHLDTSLQQQLKLQLGSCS